MTEVSPGEKQQVPFTLIERGVQGKGAEKGLQGLEREGVPTSQPPSTLAAGPVGSGEVGRSYGQGGGQAPFQELQGCSCWLPGGAYAVHRKGRSGPLGRVLGLFHMSLE